MSERLKLEGVMSLCDRIKRSLQHSDDHTTVTIAIRDLYELLQVTADYANLEAKASEELHLATKVIQDLQKESPSYEKGFKDGYDKAKEMVENLIG